MGNEWEVYFTIGWLALWILFPLGLFMSVGRLDQNSDELEQNVRLAQAPMFTRVPKATHIVHIPDWGLKVT